MNEDCKVSIERTCGIATTLSPPQINTIEPQWNVSYLESGIWISELQSLSRRNISRESETLQLIIQQLKHHQSLNFMIIFLRRYKLLIIISKYSNVDECFHCYESSSFICTIYPYPLSNNKIIIAIINRWRFN